MSEDNAIDFSLADLADLDTTDVAEMRFESLPAGAFRFRVVSATLAEGQNKETQDKQFIVDMGFEVIEVKAVTDRKVDREALIGKKHSEKRYIIPGEKALEGIGYLRSFLADIGANNAGKLGGVEGAEPGILDESVGTEFDAKITLKPDRLDPSVKYARLRLDPPKK
jgi:hypothetical protein